MNTRNKKVSVLILVLLISLTACTADRADSPTITLTALEQKIKDGFGDSDPVVRHAWGYISSIIGEGQCGDTAIVDAEITRLELTDSFDDILDGIVIDAYAFDYRLKPEDPSKASLAGANYIDDDGWWVDGDGLYLYVETENGVPGSVIPQFPFQEGIGVRDTIIEYYQLEGLIDS